MPEQYIALLRGINVGGHRVTMERLRALFRELNLDDVRSYIQTGNVFFASDTRDGAALRAEIGTHLRRSLGYDVAVCLRTVTQVEELMRRDPFKGVDLTPETRHAVSFMAEPAAAIPPLPYRTPDGAYELVGATPTELFVVWHLKDGRPGNTYGHIEKIIGVPTTTRFWHTTEKILAAAHGGK
jgi:uncharacterized protein (DUF1697 family)